MLKSILTIDPDIKKSGFCLKVQNEPLVFGSADIRGLLGIIHELKELQAKEYSVKIVVEASWLVQKSNWRTNNTGKSKEYYASQSLDTGRNQGIGMAIVQLFKAYGFDVEELKPLSKPKGWKVNGTWTPTGRQLFSRSILDSKMNDDTRDAIFIMYVKFGLQWT
jgi:hypothetical protein